MPIVFIAGIALAFFSHGGGFLLVLDLQSHAFDYRDTLRLRQ